MSNQTTNQTTNGNLPKEDPIKILSTDKLYELMMKSLKGKLAKDCPVHIADTEYYLPTPERIERILKYSTARYQSYRPEVYDCDDFAWFLKADFIWDQYMKEKPRPYAAGVMWGMFQGKPHALNFVVNREQKLQLIEPQNNTIFAPRSNDKDIWMIIC